MQSPFLKPLLRSLRPVVLNRVGSAWRWSEVAPNAEYLAGLRRLEPRPPREPDRPAQGVASGPQLRPAASLRLRDGRQAPTGPWRGRKRQDGRLGTLAAKDPGPHRPNLTAKVWAVFANRSLRQLLKETIESAWNEDKGDQPFPWHRVELWHVRDLLDLLLREVGKSMSQFSFEYDQASEAYLNRERCQKICPGATPSLRTKVKISGRARSSSSTALVDHGDPDNCRTAGRSTSSTTTLRTSTAETCRNGRRWAWTCAAEARS